MEWKDDFSYQEPLVREPVNLSLFDAAFNKQALIFDG